MKKILLAGVVTGLFSGGAFAEPANVLQGVVLDEGCYEWWGGSTTCYEVRGTWIRNYTSSGNYIYSVKAEISETVYRWGEAQITHVWDQNVNFLFKGSEEHVRRVNNGTTILVNPEGDYCSVYHSESKFVYVNGEVRMSLRDSVYEPC